MFNLDYALLQALVFLLMLIIADVILGMAIALKEKKFNLADVPRFLRTEVLPYYLGVLAVSGLAMVEDVQQFGTVPLAWAVVLAYGSKVVFVEIRKKVQGLFGIELSQK